MNPKKNNIEEELEEFDIEIDDNLINKLKKDDDSYPRPR
mgnify:CR=1 FL=1